MPDDLRHLAHGLPWRVGDLLFGWYRIEAIRSGGFGFVYLCRHIGTEEGQAIKTVRTDPLSDERVRLDMRREAEVWALLKPHPNVVSCLFVQTSPVDKRLWLGLERVDGDPKRGTTVREWMQKGPLTTEAVVRIALGVCEAMVHMLGAGFVHRDLKPENVLLTAAGFAKVTDLGLARQRVEELDGTTVTIAGTPGYMAPELWLAGSTFSSAGDVYAFGVMVWELLTGQHPFRDAGLPLCLAHRDMVPAAPRTLNPNASAALSMLAEQCLAKRPENRPSFAQVLAAIRHEWPTVPSHDATTTWRVDVGTTFNRASALQRLGKFNEAERLIEGSLREVPEDALLHAARTRLFKDMGRLQEARDSLERVAGIDSTSPPLLMLKSEAAWHLGRRDEALAVLDHALAIDPDSGWSLLAKGRLLFNCGRHDAAREVLARCAAKPSESGIQALITLGELARVDDRSSDALRCFESALSADPYGEETLCRLGRALADTGDYRRALECVRRALTVSPQSGEARLLEAEFLEKAGRVEEAEKQLRALIADSPTVGIASAHLGMLLQKTNRPDEAMVHLQEAVQAQPRNVHDYCIKAGVLGIVFEQWREALACVMSALRLDPTFVPALTMKGDVHTFFGEMELARKAYEAALLVRPHDSGTADKLEALEAFAKAHALMAARPTAALDQYRRALDLQPTNVAYLSATAIALASMQRPGEALPLFDRAFDHGPRALTGNVRWMKIQCLQALYLIREAQDLARTALSSVADSGIRAALDELLAAQPPTFTREQLAAHWFGQGIAAQKANRLPEAVEFLRRAVYVAPSHPVYLGALASCLVILSVAAESKREETEGLEAFRRSLSIRRDPTVVFNYAQALHMVGRLVDALGVAEELLTETPHDPHLIAMIADIERRLN